MDTATKRELREDKGLQKPILGCRFQKGIVIREKMYRKKTEIRY